MFRATISANMDATSLASSKIDASQAALIAAIIAGCATLVAPIVTLWGTSRRDRLLAAKRTQQLEHAAKRVVFWEGWHKAIKPFGTTIEQNAWDETAKRHLISASHEMELVIEKHDAGILRHRQEVASAKHSATGFAALPFWRRLLLFYRPRTRTAWVYFLIYQTVNALCILWFLTLPRHFDQLRDEQSAKVAAVNASPDLSPEVKALSLVEEDHNFSLRRKSLPIGILFVLLINLNYRQSALKADTSTDEYHE